MPLPLMISVQFQWWIEGFCSLSARKKQKPLIWRISNINLFTCAQVRFVLCRPIVRCKLYESFNWWLFGRIADTDRYRYLRENVRNSLMITSVEHLGTIRMRLDVYSRFHEIDGRHQKVETSPNSNSHWHCYVLRVFWSCSTCLTQCNSFVARSSEINRQEYRPHSNAHILHNQSVLSSRRH